MCLGQDSQGMSLTKAEIVIFTAFSNYNRLQRSQSRQKIFIVGASIIKRARLLQSLVFFFLHFSAVCEFFRRNSFFESSKKIVLRFLSLRYNVDFRCSRLVQLTVWFQNVETGKSVFKKRKIQHELNIRQRNRIKANISKTGNESITRSNCF